MTKKTLKAVWNDDKTGVMVTGDENCSVPKTHRFWVDFGINKLEEAGLIGDQEDVNLAQVAQAEIITELNWVDLQLKYHSAGDTKRKVATLPKMKAYAVACRDYVRNFDGVLTIVGEKPVRPS